MIAHALTCACVFDCDVDRINVCVFVCVCSTQNQQLFFYINDLQRISGKSFFGSTMQKPLGVIRKQNEQERQNEKPTTCNLTST